MLEEDFVGRDDAMAAIIRHLTYTPTRSDAIPANN